MLVVAHTAPIVWHRVQWRQCQGPVFDGRHENLAMARSYTNLRPQVEEECVHASKDNEVVCWVEEVVVHAKTGTGEFVCMRLMCVV